MFYLHVEVVLAFLRVEMQVAGHDGVDVPTASATKVSKVSDLLVPLSASLLSAAKLVAAMSACCLFLCFCTRPFPGGRHD